MVHLILSLCHLVKGIGMDPIIILQAGVASGTVLLFAAIGEICHRERGPFIYHIGRAGRPRRMD